MRQISPLLMALTGFFLISQAAWSVSAATQYLILDNTPRNISLGSSSNAHPQQIGDMLNNPNALTSMTEGNGRGPVGMYLSTQPLLFDYRNNLMFVRFPLMRFNLGAYAQVVTSPAFEAIDDFGDSEGQVSETFFSGGLGGSKKFKLYRNYLVVGATAKVYHSKLGTFSTTSGALDVGVNYYFNTPRPRFLPYISELRNTSVSIVVKNIGPAVSFASESIGAPISYEAALRYGIYSRKEHVVDFYSSFEHHLSFGNFDIGFGMEYNLFRYLAVRAGVKNGSLTGLDFVAGMGIVNKNSKRFHYRLDYAVAPSSALGSVSHTLGAGASYNFSRFERPTVNKKYDLEIVAEVKRFVRSIDKRRANPPANIEDVYDEMVKAGYPRPNLTNGRMIFVPELKEAIYIRREGLSRSGAQPKYYDVLQLKDGSLIVGTILNKDPDGLIVRADFGETTVPYDKIDRLQHKDLQAVDEDVKRRVQYLVNQFKTDKGRLPDDLQELEAYTKESLQVMPKPVQKTLTYDKNTGVVGLF